MDCPICKEGRLEDNCCDLELVCNECGSAFCLEYAGMYQEESQERIDDGFESKEFLDKYSNEIRKWKGFL